MTAIGSNVFVVGGNTEADEDLVDVWCLSTNDIHHWKKIVCMGDVPTQRSCSAIVALDEYAF